MNEVHIFQAEANKYLYISQITEYKKYLPPHCPTTKREKKMHKSLELMGGIQVAKDKEPKNRQIAIC